MAWDCSQHLSDLCVGFTAYHDELHSFTSNSVLSFLHRSCKGSRHQYPRDGARVTASGTSRREESCHHAHSPGCFLAFLSLFSSAVFLSSCSHLSPFFLDGPVRCCTSPKLATNTTTTCSFEFINQQCKRSEHQQSCLTQTSLSHTD